MGLRTSVKTLLRSELHPASILEPRLSDTSDSPSGRGVKRAKDPPRVG